MEERKEWGARGWELGLEKRGEGKRSGLWVRWESVWRRGKSGVKKGENLDCRKEERGLDGRGGSEEELLSYQGK